MFPLDIPALLKIGAHFNEWVSWIINPNNGSGRYVPIYWLYYCFNYYLFGSNLSLYFLAQSLVFLISVFLLSYVCWFITKSKTSTFLCFVLSYLGSPIAENIGTLGKPEPLAFLFISLFLFVFFCFDKCKYNIVMSFLIKHVSLLVLFVLAIWSKETSIVLFAFVITGASVAFFLSRAIDVDYRRDLVKNYFVLLFVLVVSFLVSKMPHFILPESITDTSYVSYEISIRLIWKNFKFYIIQQPDVFVSGVFSLWLLFCVGWKLIKKDIVFDDQKFSAYVFLVASCAMSWGYFCGLLIWRWPMQYYMLLPSVLFKFIAICTVCLFSSGFVSSYLNAFYRVLLLFVAIYGAFSFYYVMQSQIAYSLLYSSALDKYVKLAKKEPGSLIIESYPFFAEQISGTHDLIQTYWHENFNVKGIGDIINPQTITDKDVMKLLNITPTMIDDNVKNLPKAEDYLLVFTGKKIATWFLRGVTPYFSSDSALKLDGSYDLELMADERISSKVVYFNIWSKRLDAGNSELGYKLYRVKSRQPKFVWRNHFLDGWVGRSSSLVVNSSYGKPLYIKVSIPQFNLPNGIRIFKNGALYKKVNFVNADEKVVLLSGKINDGDVYTFQVDRVVSPEELGINNDTRELGARLDLHQYNIASNLVH